MLQKYGLVVRTAGLHTAGTFSSVQEFRDYTSVVADCCDMNLLPQESLFYETTHICAVQISLCTSILAAHRRELTDL